MKKLSIRLSVVVEIIVLACFSAQAAGRDMVQVPYDQCAELVKECFVESEVEQSNCFFSSASHPFCEGTKLGDLVLKRWTLSPEKSSVIEAPPGLLGPQVINGECLKNFDAKFSGMLIGGELTEDSITQTDAELENCKKNVSDQLSRP